MNSVNSTHYKEISPGHIQMSRGPIKTILARQNPFVHSWKVIHSEHLTGDMATPSFYPFFKRVDTLSVFGRDKSTLSDILGPKGLKRMVGIWECEKGDDDVYLAYSLKDTGGNIDAKCSVGVDFNTDSLSFDLALKAIKSDDNSSLFGMIMKFPLVNKQANKMSISGLLQPNAGLGTEGETSNVFPFSSILNVKNIKGQVIELPDIPRLLTLSYPGDLKIFCLLGRGSDMIRLDKTESSVILQPVSFCNFGEEGHMHLNVWSNAPKGA